MVDTESFKAVENKEICLVIVFNHRYDKNIEKLEDIYAKRFKDIFYLVPFYQGRKKNVITVYDSSATFQGFFAQSFEKIFHPKYSHYVFIGDDLILNPKINYENVVQELKLTHLSGYIKSLSLLSSLNFEWPDTHPTLSAWPGFWSSLKVWEEPIWKYVNWEKELPTYSEAVEIVRKHGISPNALKLQNLRYRDVKLKIKEFAISLSFERFQDLFQTLKLLKQYKDKLLPYPLFCGYSDFIIIPSQSLKQFCHLCGVFAAMDLFVEVAIPTAMALSCDKIVTEKDTGWRGIEIWDKNEIEELLKQRKIFSLKDIPSLFNDAQLYIHPVKLSGLN